MAKGFGVLACVMDIYNRKSLSSVLPNTRDASFCVDATKQAVRLYGVRRIINTDQGSQLPAGAFVTGVTAFGARLSMDGTGAWTDSIEPFRRSLKVEEVDLRAYETGADPKRWSSLYIN